MAQIWICPDPQIVRMDALSLSEGQAGDALLWQKNSGSGRLS